MSQYHEQHKTYFESPAGLEFLTSLQAALSENHTKAEDQPDYARDHVQRAKGNREVLDIISSLTAEGKPAQQS